MMRRIKLLLTMVLIGTILTACSTGMSEEDGNGNFNWFNKVNEEAPDPLDKLSDEETPETIGSSGVNVYFYNPATEQLASEIRRIPDELSDNQLVERVVREMINGPTSPELTPVISEETAVNKVDIAEDVLVVDLTPTFYQSENLSLARAALTNTLLDLGDVQYVKLIIDGREGTISKENQGLLGLLSRYPLNSADIIAQEAQTFANEEAAQINQQLFFQDYAGQYLLPEVRTITVRNGKYAEVILNELIRGPVSEGQGYYPTLPKGTLLFKTEAVQNAGGAWGVSLYFSKEFKTQFFGGVQQENNMISSILYSLSTLPNAHYVNFYYDKGNGEFTNEAVGEIPLDESLATGHYPNKLGKRIRVYFGEEDSMLLVPEYRAIAGKEKDLPTRILAELITDPLRPGSVRVIPADVPLKGFRINVANGIAVIDVPTVYFEMVESDSNRVIRDIYAVVNTLTDPINDTTIREVQFTVEGRLIESYKDIFLRDSFVMNPALIKEGS